MTKMPTKARVGRPCRGLVRTPRLGQCQIDSFGLAGDESESVAVGASSKEKVLHLIAAGGVVQDCRSAVEDDQPAKVDEREADG